MTDDRHPITDVSAPRDPGETPRPDTIRELIGRIGWNLCWSRWRAPPPSAPHHHNCECGHAHDAHATGGRAHSLPSKVEEWTGRSVVQMCPCKGYQPVAAPVRAGQDEICEACGHLWIYHTHGGMCQGTAKGIECHCVTPRESPVRAGGAEE